MGLMKYCRVAIPGDPMSRLYVNKKGHGQEAIYNFVEESETDHRSSFFEGLLVKLRQQ